MARTDRQRTPASPRARPAPRGLAGSPWLFGAAALLYLALPGHYAAWSNGLPLGDAALGALALLLAALALLGRPSRLWLPLAAAVALLCLPKLAAWAVQPTPGALAQYRSFDDDKPVAAPERSTDFPLLRGATRIDPKLGLSGDSFPLYFFNNNGRWNNYKPGQTPHDDLPYTLAWDAYLDVPHDGQYRFWLDAEGPARLRLGGKQILHVESAGARRKEAAQLTLHAGLAPIHVDYERLEGQGRRVKVEWDAGGKQDTIAPPYLFASPPGPLQLRADPAATLVGQGTDLLAALALAVALAELLRLHALAVLRADAGPRDRRAHLAVTAYRLVERPALVLVVLFFFWTALGLNQELSGRMDYLRAGDDPLTRETQAREIGINGPLMTFGARPGEGSAYYSQVLYPYLLAAIHRVAGEPLSGVYVTQVTLIGALVVLVYLLAQRLFGTPAALLAGLGFGWLAWTEYVPVAQTLFAEDLYTPLIAAALLALCAAFGRPGRWRYLAAGLLLALAVLTRFTAIIFVPAAALLLWLELRAQGWPRRRALGGLAIVVAPLLVGLALVLARNVYLAEAWTFVPTNAGNNLTKLHKPTKRVDLSRTANPLYDALHLDDASRQTLEFIRQDPEGYLDTVVPQALYAAGYVRQVDRHGENQPWFMAGLALCLLAPLLAPRARSRAALLLVLFVLGHWLMMAVFFASQYHFRLILPMYPAVYVLAAAALWRPFELLGRPLAARRARPASAPPQGEAARSRAGLL